MDAHGDASADDETLANFDARAYSGTPTDDAHALLQYAFKGYLTEENPVPRLTSMVTNSLTADALLRMHPRD